MNRRKWFNRLLGTCALVALAPRIAFGELSKSGPNKAVVNPLWEKAEYEVQFMLTPEMLYKFEMKAFESKAPELYDFITYQMRNGKMVRV